jgi:hypothetical protein
VFKRIQSNTGLVVAACFQINHQLGYDRAGGGGGGGGGGIAVVGVGFGQSGNEIST